MRKLIAITGLNGFLGARIRAVLEGDDYAVEHLPLDVRRSCDATREWLRARRPAALVHTAGIVDVRLCHQQPLQAFQAHVAETANLLEAVRLECPQMPTFYIATDKSFGEQQDCGLDTPYRPIYPYDASKACEDLLVESYRSTYGLPIYLLRFPNFYGEGDLHAERLVPGVCLAAVDGREMVVRTQLHGSYRQYIYVGDAADIVRRAISDALEGRSLWKNSHFGPPDIKSVGDVIADVEQIMGVKIRVQVLNQPSESSRISLRDENAMNYGYTDWMTGLAHAIAFYQDAARRNA
jgi:nucleoside-diphosphate-sugar epimerase